MGAGASAQANNIDGVQAPVPIEEVSIEPIELTANTRRALLKWKEHAHLHKTIQCDIKRPQAQKIMQWVGLDLGDARGDVCTAIETLLHLTHLNLRLTAFRSHGSYGMVIDAISAEGEPLIIKLMLLSEKGTDYEDDGISNVQFENAVKIQRSLAEKQFVHLKMSVLKDVLRIRVNGNLIGIQVMTFIKGKMAYDVLITALQDESDPGAATEVVKLLAKALREFSAQGVVHGDPHLSNYLIDGSNVTLIDFDFASRSEETAVDIFKTLSSIGRACKIAGKISMVEALVRVFIDTLCDDKETALAFLSGLNPADDAELNDQLLEKMREEYHAYRQSLP